MKVTHYQIVPVRYGSRPYRQGGRKQLVNPTTDVICVVVLTGILLLAGYLHP